MSALTSRRAALAQAVGGLLREPLSTALALALATVALLLPLLVATLALPLRPAWQQLDVPPQAIVFVAAGTTASDAAALRAKLAEQPSIAEATYVTRDAALAELVRRAPGGALPDFKANPLPDSIVLRFARGLSPDAADAAVAAARKLARVDAVQYDGAWHRRWSAAASIGTTLAAGGAAALLVLAALAVAAAAGLPSITGQDELRLLALVGARPADRRRPFAYAGAVIGLVAGALACGLAAGTLAGLAPALAGFSGLSGAGVVWTLLPWPVQVGTVLLAGLLGLLAGGRSGRRADRRAAA